MIRAGRSGPKRRVGGPRGTPPGNDRRQASSRRHDQLAWIATESQHEPWPRGCRPIEAADRAYNKAGSGRVSLDLNVTTVAPQVRHEMHPLIRHVDLEQPCRLPDQRGCERITLLAVHLTHATNMGREMPLLHELRENGLVQGWWLSIHEITSCGKCGKHGTRHNRVTEPQTRKQRLVEGADVDDTLVLIQPLQRSQRRAGVAELAGVVVLHYERAALARPRQQLQAPRHRQYDPGRKLVRRRDERRSRLGRQA